MKRTALRIAASQLEAELLPHLIGRVSHVTTRAALSCILQDGALKPNQDSSRGYGSTNSSYFRSRGCLSLTDLRSASREEIEKTLAQFYFLNPQLSKTNFPVFFVFKPEINEGLIHWSEWRERTTDHGVRIVAPTEAGYASEIPLSSVEKIIEVEVELRSKSSILSSENGT
jgi:hypothetical protein